ncbi:aspartyl/asparaginyl beta-hydroxylase domain-containing protein [Limibacillus sp. MBR-115]|uniref:aspartyl/asparaginyl beta-hydroxylase domain-containing protein n=1 Tax=Limibacillus sp. MBR-115 TaxID=3156465 RepID=UPI0033936BE7
MAAQKISADPTSTKKEKQSAIVRVGKKLRPAFNRWIARDSVVGDRPVFEPGVFSFTKDLEANWKLIRQEVADIVEKRTPLPSLQEISPDHYRIATDNKWRTFFLRGYGYKMHQNCARCPETTRIVEQIPGLNSAFFSVLAPGAVIPRHKGVTKAILTCHLGLMVPRDRQNCTIQVDDQTLAWEAGKAIVFDDTFYHEVHNRTDEERIVLLLHFKRPVSYPGKLAADLFLGGVRMSPFVQSARRNVEEFEALHR